MDNDWETAVCMLITCECQEGHVLREVSVEVDEVEENLGVLGSNARLALVTKAPKHHDVLSSFTAKDKDRPNQTWSSDWHLIT